MKIKLYILTLLLIFIFSSCNKEKSQYTFNGRFINGTTGVPIANIQVEFIGEVGGYPNSKYIDLGSAMTDNDGYFKFTYSIDSKFPGSLSLVFKNPNNPYIDLKVISNIPILKDQFQTVYVSDSLSILLLFNTNNPLKEGENLHIKFGIEHGFDFILNKDDLKNLNNKYTIRKSVIGTSVIWERNSMDTTIINSKNLYIQGDPFIDSITINY